MATRRKLERQTLEVVPVSATEESRSSPADLLELITRQTPQAQERPLFGGVIVGTLKGVGKSGEPLVDFGANPLRAELVARSTVTVRPSDVGRQIVLLFEEGDPRRPIVVGVLQQPAAQEQTAAESMTDGEAREVEIDGERLVLTARQEIVLRCGKATIILTRAGKILIRGAYLLNRSSGVNRIKGGSVQIN